MKSFLILVVLMFAVVCSVKADVTHEVNVLERTIYREAANQGSNGMYIVGCIIEQRMTERKLSASEVCLQKSQFSCWNKATEEDKQYRALPKDWASDYAHDLAVAIVSGKGLDCSVIGFANHYCRIDKHPSWAKKKYWVKLVGVHNCYRLPVA